MRTIKSHVRNYKTIPKIKKQTILIDDEDYEWVSAVKWYTTSGYAKSYEFRMHRLIMNAPPDMEVDHINGNGLDNRRANLRLCTKSQNQANCKTQIGTSKYKGVCWHDMGKKWLAYIVKDYKTIYLGLYKTEDEAGLAYNFGAKHHFGEFAKPNPITTGGYLKNG